MDIKIYDTPKSETISKAAVTDKAGQTSAFAKCLTEAARNVETGGENRLGEIFHTAAERYGVPENLLKAVAKAESGFRADAVSHCGATGIMQLMPSTAAALGVKDASDPEQNIMGGAKYLGELLHCYGGDAKLALAAYNAGGGSVEKYGGVPPFAETQAYVRKVLQYAEESPSSAGTAAGAAKLTRAAESTAVSPNLSADFSEEDWRHFVEISIERMEQNAADSTSRKKHSS